ncbi:MAG TPA: PAS domain S-box protein [Candidatus Angelobacter sp.]|nr:PAS domain S-box protein [Candidatus Angelobacter sp.]
MRHKLKTATVTHDIGSHNEEQAQRWLAAIVESSDDAIASKDLNGIVTSWNQSAEKLFGYKAQEIVGQPITLIIPPELQADESRILATIRAGKKIDHFETVRLHKDGHRIDVLLTILPVRSPQGNIIGAAKIVRDIGRQRALEAAAVLLSAIVESSDDAIASKDLNGIVTSWNKSAERLFGYKAEEIIGRPITLIIPPELQGDEPTILKKIRAGEKIDHFETVRISKSGERIDVSLSISPVRNEQGRIIGAAKIVRDITENKKIERALRTTEKLAAAGRMAATVAHEINNPLEAVTNLVYLARKDLNDPKKVAAYLELAGRELDRVAHIARQTLGFYRESASPTRFNVSQLLDDLLRLYDTRLQTRKIKVTRQFENDIEVTAIPGEIRQAFSNLITNSIDAMSVGGSLQIRVSRARPWRKPQFPGVRITVLDSGSGITPRHKRNLFQPFFTTKSDVGTGLGLWITRNIIEKHGGTIRVWSRTGPNGHGTAFSVFLPLEGKLVKTEQSSSADTPGNHKIPSRVVNA